MDKHCEHNPDELMGSGHNRLFVAQSLALSFVEIGPEQIIREYNGFRHYPDDPSQVSVPSLAYPA